MHFCFLEDVLVYWEILWFALRSCGLLRYVVLYLHTYVVVFWEMWWFAERCGGLLRPDMWLLPGRCGDLLGDIVVYWEMWRFSMICDGLLTIIVLYWEMWRFIEICGDLLEDRSAVRCGCLLEHVMLWIPGRCGGFVGDVAIYYSIWSCGQVTDWGGGLLEAVVFYCNVRYVVLVKYFMRFTRSYIHTFNYYDTNFVGL